MSNRVDRVDTLATMSYQDHLTIKYFVNESVSLRAEHDDVEPVSRKQDLMSEWVKVVNVYIAHSETMRKPSFFPLPPFCQPNETGMQRSYSLHTGAGMAFLTKPRVLVFKPNVLEMGQSWTLFVI